MFNNKIQSLLFKKKNHQKITMLTAYDYAFASVVDEAGVDVILVGDSLANVVLGLEKTADVTMEAMLHHAKAVRRAVKKSLLVGDMPFESYQKEEQKAVLNAKRFVDEAGCDAVKLEWFEKAPSVTKKIVQEGIAVMGHVGLTPQTAEQLGGLKVQGKDVVSARKIIQNAKDLESAGCFSLVLECIPSSLGQLITEKISIPTIGIGAGVHCDGQVLVLHDILGLGGMKRPHFVKQYVNVKEQVLQAIQKFRYEVETSQFPDDAHSYFMDEKEWQKVFE
ncbi:MAG TPA: 3-methyl-2-oxobutanoate hydroxymethyltransferase [Candidatus Omnitrophota bacterium]|nr:3-methyl-2-oxobutanoate hydroxymethyltransferase [Candidatus Omnitrophota bacterium]